MPTHPESLEETIARVKAFTDDVLSMEPPRDLRLIIDFDALEQKLSLAPPPPVATPFFGTRA